jgi:hypothetical protein
MEMNEIMDAQKYNKSKLKGFFGKNSILAPILINQEGRKQAVMVHINPISLAAELYYRPSEKHDNSNYPTFI